MKRRDVSQKGARSRLSGSSTSSILRSYSLGFNRGALRAIFFLRVCAVVYELSESCFYDDFITVERLYVIVRAMWEFSVNLIKRITRTSLTTRSALLQKGKPAKVLSVLFNPTALFAVRELK